MKADPDFHPLAASWLDSTATPPEQQLLGEILHDPESMSEYAALCRTEALLGQHACSAAQRRAALARILAAPPWPRRLLRFCQRPAIRWSAAALVAALLAWALWPASDSSVSPVVVKPNPSPRMMPAMNGARDFRADASVALPPADKTIEPYLRRYYVKPISLSGELTVSVQALAAEIHMMNGEPLSVDLQSNGDAPVHLKLGVALPAWTMLEILALQSGTEAVVSGRSVVFRDAKKPVRLDGTLHEEERIPAFQVVLPVPQDEDHGIRLALVAVLAGESFGSSLNVHSFGPETVAFSGKSRTVLALKKACNSAPRAPQQLQWSVQVFSLAHGLFEKALAENCPGRLNTPNGLFLSDDAERQMLVRALSTQKGVDMLTLPILVSDPGTRVEWTTNPEGVERKQDELSAAFEGVIDSSFSLDVSVALKMEKWNESTQGWSTHDQTTQVSILPGQTIVLGGVIGEDGMERAHLISAQIIDTTGPPKPDPPKEPEREELPYGIPVVGKQGMVQSPYAPDKGMIDVDGFKRGTRVECPYTGKHFRVP